MSIQRDQRGQIEVNGRWPAWVGDVLRVWPIIVTMVGGLGGYILLHERQHARLDVFVEKGERFTHEDGKALEESISSKLVNYIGENYPPDSLLAKVDANAASLAELRVQVGRIDERTKAIQRILEDD